MGSSSVAIREQVSFTLKLLYNHIETLFIITVQAAILVQTPFLFSAFK